MNDPASSTPPPPSAPALLARIRELVFRETQEAFAEALGVEPRTVRRWESGETQLKLARLQQLAARKPPAAAAELFAHLLRQLEAALGLTPPSRPIPLPAAATAAAPTPAPAPMSETWEAPPGALEPPRHPLAKSARSAPIRGRAILAEALAQTQRPAFAPGVPWAVRVLVSLAALARITPAPVVPWWRRALTRLRAPERRRVALLTAWLAATANVAGIVAWACVRHLVPAPERSSSPVAWAAAAHAETPEEIPTTYGPEHGNEGTTTRGSHQQRQVPETPFPGQMTGACPPGPGLAMINGGCWWGGRPAPCNPELEYEHDGRCWAPMPAGRRAPPRSVTP